MIKHAVWLDKRFRWAAFALFAVKLYLVAAQPIFAITPANKDEGLSIRLTASILDGDWLGVYDANTLVKGAAYSLFVAASVISGIPLPLAQHLLYAFAAWVLLRALRPLLPGDGWALVLFAIVLWNPVSFEMATLGRVLRHNLVTPLGMLVFAGLFSLHTRADATNATRTLWAAMLGLSGGALWLTREETFWIVPSVVMVVSAVLLFNRRANQGRVRSVWPVGVAIVVGVMPVATVAALNWHYYGWFGTCELRAPEYIDGYAALNRVIPPDGRKRMIPVNRSVREMAYEVSPAFAELRPYLEGAIGKAASRTSNEHTGLKDEEMEMAGGWFFLAMRDAVQAAGQTRDARGALDFYAQMGREINEACDDGRLPAGPRRHTLRPVWQPGYTELLLRKLLPMLDWFASARPFSATTPDSIGTQDGLHLFRDLTQWHISHVKDQPQLTMRHTIHWAHWRVAILEKLGRAMIVVCYALMVVGMIAWAFQIGFCFRARRWPGFLWWATTATWGGAAAVVAVVLFMDITYFPVSNPGYFSAAYPLAYLAAGLSITMAVAEWRALRTARSNRDQLPREISP